MASCCLRVLRSPITKSIVILSHFHIRIGRAVSFLRASGVSIDPEKVEAVMSWERPKSVLEICSFLGLAGYYRRFIEDFSRLAAPMTKLTQKEVKFEWNDSCERAFQELKPRLTLAPILVLLERG